jgi:hypothetical protein
VGLDIKELIVQVWKRRNFSCWSGKEGISRAGLDKKELLMQAWIRRNFLCMPGK